jgi:hypothetical protein
MNLFNAKEPIVKEKDQVLTLSNGCRLNISLYGRVLAAKISAGEGIRFGSEHYYEVFKNDKYRTAVEKEVENVLEENKLKK